MNKTREVRGTIYRDYSVEVNPTGAPEGRLCDSFAIFKHRGDDWRASMFHRSIDESAAYPTEQDAKENALKLARAWIDAQYK